MVLRKIVLKTLITTFIISAILGILIIILDLWNKLTINVLLSTIIIFGFSIPGLCCSTSYEKVKNKTISTIGMSICALSCIYFLLLIWNILEFKFFDGLNWKIILSGILLSSSFGHICLLQLVDSENKSVINLKKCTIGLSIVMDILLLSIVLCDIEVSGKVLSIIAILILLGTIILPLMNKLNNKTTEEDKYKKIEQLKKLLDDKAITEDEYEKEKNKILK